MSVFAPETESAPKSGTIMPGRQKPRKICTLRIFLQLAVSPARAPAPCVRTETAPRQLPLRPDARPPPLPRAGLDIGTLAVRATARAHAAHNAATSPPLRSCDLAPCATSSVRNVAAPRRCRRLFPLLPLTASAEASCLTRNRTRSSPALRSLSTTARTMPRRRRRRPPPSLPTFACKPHPPTCQGQGRWQGCQGPQEAQGRNLCVPGVSPAFRRRPAATHAFCMQFFTLDKRAEVVASNPGIGNTEVLGKVAELWKGLDAAGLRATRRRLAAHRRHSQGAVREEGCRRQGAPHQGDGLVHAPGCQRQGQWCQGQAVCARAARRPLLTTAQREGPQRAQAPHLRLLRLPGRGARRHQDDQPRCGPW